MPDDLFEEAEKLQKSAQDEAKRAIEKLDPDHVTSFSDFYIKVQEVVEHAKSVEKFMKTEFPKPPEKGK